MFDGSAEGGYNGTAGIARFVYFRKEVKVWVLVWGLRKMDMSSLDSSDEARNFRVECGKGL